MLSRRQALKAAIKQRRCPPFSIKTHPEWHKEYAAHCQICPFCESHDRDNKDGTANSLTQAFTALGRKYKDNFKDPFKQSAFDGKTRIKSGDVRLLKAREPSWHNGYYFNPPVVAVLQEAPDSAGCLPVAQIFFDCALAGPGDLVADSMFIETWNLYNIKPSSPGFLLDTLDNSVIKAVKAMHMDKDYCPKWAPVLTPLIKNDPRVLFRKMEQETALFFNDNALVPPVFHFLDSPGLMRDLKAQVDGIKWDSPPENIWEILINAVFPDDYYPKAAADSEALYYYANLYIYEKGRIKAIKAVRAEAECIKNEKGVTCSIFFPELPVEGDVLWAYSYLKISASEIIAPETIKTSVQEKSLVAEFITDRRDTGSLQTALFCYL